MLKIINLKIKQRLIKSIETRNNGITALLSEKIPTLVFNNK